MSEFYALYDALADSVRSAEPAASVTFAERWAMAETAEGLGLAMATPGDSIAPRFAGGLQGLPLCEAAKAVSSWNLTEASCALAAANAFFNTSSRMEALGSFEPYENYSTAGIDLRGRTVGLIGHLHGPKGLRELARAVYTIERSPQPGDYPDAACDALLPQCDLVIITGSALVNKTLPHLLELCEQAIVILTGPSVPLCPALLDCGIDRIAGMAIADRAALRARVESGRRGSPYGEGIPFLLKKK